MSRRSFVLRRLAGMVVTVWVVLTVGFAFVTSVADPQRYRVSLAAAIGGNSTKAVNAYLAATNQNVPITQRYVNWTTGLLTLDLGWSFSYEAPVWSVLVDHLGFTLSYFVPALAFAVVAGTAVRVYTVASERSRFDRLTNGLSYLGVSLPIFLFAYLIKWWVLPYYFLATGDEITYFYSRSPLAPANLQAAVYPATVMGLYLFGIQLRHAGTELGEYTSAQFVKTARGKGAGVWRVGRHIVRNTLISLLSLFFVELLGMVLVAIVVVEAVAGVPGFGSLTLQAMQGGHDLPLMLGVSLLPVVLGVVANFAQDIGYALLYPHVDVEE